MDTTGSPLANAGRNSPGDSEPELFDAAQRHRAHHHPQLLGALEMRTVAQMAEDVGAQPR